MAHSNQAASLQAIILAAGTSSRFKTGRSKLVEKICGKEMVLYPTEVLAQLDIPTLMVVGFQRDAVEQVVKDGIEKPITFIHQEEQKGTGHAIACTKDAWTAENILVMNGDMPLISPDIIQKIIKKHIESAATITFATAHHCDPEALYGRVIQADKDIQIVEAKDFEGDLAEQCCVNAGIYLIKKEFLQGHIDKLHESKKTHEWYITDLVSIASQQKLKVQTVPVPFDRIRGVNDFKELWAAEQIKKSEIIQYWMHQGVRFSIAHNVQIDADVTIGAGSYVGSGVQLLRGTTIGKDCIIGAFSHLEKAIIGDRTEVKPHAVIERSKIISDAHIGPFSYIHGNSTVEQSGTVGSFVEVNRSIVGKHSKVKHLSYLGDAEIGSHVNVGAGLVTCNFDGSHKYKTTIEDQAFIGANNTLIAPVTIGKHSITAAGSTITHDVPKDSLALARARQTNKEGYAQQVREKNKKKLEERNKQVEGSWTPAAKTTIKQAE